MGWAALKGPGRTISQANGTEGRNESYAAYEAEADKSGASWAGVLKEHPNPVWRNLKNQRGWKYQTPRTPRKSSTPIRMKYVFLQPGSVATVAGSYTDMNNVFHGFVRSR